MTAANWNRLKKKHVDHLREMVKTLEEYHEIADQQLRNAHPDCEATLMRSTDGRFILLDSLTALVNAQTLLAQADFQKPDS